MILVTLLCAVYCRELAVRVLQYCVAYKDLHVAQLLLASPSTGSMLLCDSMVLLLLIPSQSAVLHVTHPCFACIPSFLPSVIGRSRRTAAADCGADAPAVQQRGMCPQGGDGDN